MTIKCHRCDENAKKSNVYLQSSSKTLAYNHPYYDHEGSFHLHDANNTIAQYECINGHRWKIIASSKCWCGWPEAMPDELLIEESSGNVWIDLGMENADQKFKNADDKIQDNK